jgi:hypothetical protein
LFPEHCSQSAPETVEAEKVEHAIEAAAARIDFEAGNITTILAQSVTDWFRSR